MGHSKGGNIKWHPALYKFDSPGLCDHLLYLGPNWDIKLHVEVSTRNATQNWFLIPCVRLNILQPYSNTRRTRKPVKQSTEKLAPHSNCLNFLHVFEGYQQLLVCFCKTLAKLFHVEMIPCCIRLFQAVWKIRQNSTFIQVMGAILSRKVCRNWYSSGCF